MNCPDHKENKLRKTKVWTPPEGIDPKMIRLSCLECVDYWYKAPKHCIIRHEEFEQLLLSKSEED